MSGEAVCFDMYGTLCDTSSVVNALSAELDVPDDVVTAIDGLWRQKQLAYSYQRGLMGAYRPFGEVTAEALSYALAYYGHTPGEPARERILAAYDDLDPFPGVEAALAALDDAGYRLAVLSNGDPEMLSTLATNAGLDGYLDDLVSADEVRTFKPAAVVYENAADRLDVPLGECWLVSGNAWDVAGASSAGMRTVWVNRAREPFERIGGDPTASIRSLANLPGSILN